MFRLTSSLTKTSKHASRKVKLPKKFSPLIRWGETYTHSLDAARNELARQKLLSKKYCYGRVARVECDGKVTVDVMLKRYNGDLKRFFDHVLPVLCYDNKNVASVGDQVIMRNVTTLADRSTKDYSNLHYRFMAGETDSKVSLSKTHDFPAYKPLIFRVHLLVVQVAGAVIQNLNFNAKFMKKDS